MSPAGRPTDAPRLATLDPDTVAIEVCSSVLDHLSSLSLKYDMRVEVRAPAEICGANARNSSLGDAVATLTRYAQTGRDLDAPVEEYLQSVCEALYVGVTDGPSYTVPVLDADEDADPDTAIGVVLLAAVARARLRDGRPVHTRQLAALASLAHDSVKALGSRGEVRVRDGEVRAAEARRWLGGRGVTA